MEDYAKRISNWDGREETKPRELLQNLGIELVRNKINPRLFISRTLEDIEVFFCSHAREDWEYTGIPKFATNRDDEGNITERSWNDLSNEEKINILNMPLETEQGDNQNDLTEEEINLLSQIR